MKLAIFFKKYVTLVTWWPVPAPARQHQWSHLHHPYRLATQQFLIHASVWKPES